MSVFNLQLAAMTDEILKLDFRGEKIIKSVRQLDSNSLAWGDDEAWHIGFGVDENWIAFAATTIASIIEHNATQKIIFHIFTDFISEDSNSKLKKYAYENSNVGISVYFVNNELLSKMPTNKQWNISVYYRAIIPVVLNGKAGRFLYLDADILCLNSLKELFTLDLTGYVAAVVKDLKSDELAIKFPEKIGYTPLKYYFNSGVMLFNVDLYCKLDTFSRFIQIIEKYGDKFKYFDQDAFNIILEGQTKLLSSKFNWQDFDKDSDKICIIHFIGQLKPWFLSLYGNYFDEWRKIYYNSFWKDIPLKVYSGNISTLRLQSYYWLKKGFYLKSIGSYFEYIKKKIL